MGTILIKYKIMPKTISENFEEIKKILKKTIMEHGGKINQVEEQLIAFGLKAIILSISIDEKKETTDMERGIESIEGVSSVDVIDYRRAIE